MAYLRLNYAEIGRILREVMRGPIDDLAHQIAARVDVGSVTDAQVVVRSSTSKTRARATVTIEHPAGLSMDLKHGTLRKAAASVGLEVRSK